jgi:23S rRNA (cytidine1920-2'-O)/16S rRNA (cytidine1409-2'-O)-methyltransferase
MKKRLDVLLVERGLAESRAQAQALVLAGRVPGFDKPGTQVDESAELDVQCPPPYVSRGGEKLAHALGAFGVEPQGRDCLDVGASTGGFTDVLLQRGAARVIAVDVGYGQLHERVRRDPRVTVLERTNARELRELPFAPELVVADVSFISLKPCWPWRSRGGRRSSWSSRSSRRAGARSARAASCATSAYGGGSSVSSPRRLSAGRERQSGP